MGALDRGGPVETGETIAVARVGEVYEAAKALSAALGPENLRPETRIPAAKLRTGKTIAAIHASFDNANLAGLTVRRTRVKIRTADGTAASLISVRAMAWAISAATAVQIDVYKNGVDAAQATGTLLSSMTISSSEAAVVAENRDPFTNPIGTIADGEYLDVIAIGSAFPGGIGMEVEVLLAVPLSP